MTLTSGAFIGVGVGPGDPELITLKAFRLIQQADVISYIANESGISQSKQIAIDALKTVRHEQLEVPVVMPMNEDRRLANRIYNEAAMTLQAHLSQGKTVVFLCEGDPLFFGSFAYLLERLQDGNYCQVVPGISSVHAASSRLRLPLTMLKESFAVISGRHSDEQIREALINHDSVVIMKAGRSRQRILALLEETQRVQDANYLEYIGRENEQLVANVETLANESGPYFSIFVVLSKRDTK